MLTLLHVCVFVVKLAYKVHTAAQEKIQEKKRKAEAATSDQDRSAPSAPTNGNGDGGQARGPTGSIPLKKRFGAGSSAAGSTVPPGVGVARQGQGPGAGDAAALGGRTSPPGVVLPHGAPPPGVNLPTR